MPDETNNADESPPSSPPPPPSSPPAAVEAPKAPLPDVHPSLLKHVMGAAEAQAKAEAAVLEHEKQQGKTLAEKLAADAGDAKAKLLARLEKRHSDRFSHSITPEKDGGLTIHSFVMFGTKRIATARYLSAAELEKTAPHELVAHEAMQLHTLAHITGA